MLGRGVEELRDEPRDAPIVVLAEGIDHAVAAEAESEKRRRYPAGQTPWRAVPLAVETGGRLGKDAFCEKIQWVALVASWNISEKDLQIVQTISVDR